MFDTIEKFETIIAEFYGAPYAVSVDCCTHAIELCLRLLSPATVSCPNHTYISVPFTFDKLSISWTFSQELWKDYYYIGNTNIIDAAVFWQEDGYIPGTFMCLSFQFKKHLSLGRGGMILLDDATAYEKLKMMSYDGRSRLIPWADQNFKEIGYHYYMTPETAVHGVNKFLEVRTKLSKQWTFKDYPDLSSMAVFKNK